MSRHGHPPIESFEPVEQSADARRLVSRLAGGALLIALLAGTVALGADFASFLNLPSLLLVVGGTGALLLATFGHDGCLTALRLTMRGRRDAEHTDALRRGDPVAFFRLAAAYALVAGLVGMLIGLIQMISNMSNPSELGAGLAMTLVTQLYGALLALPCIALAVIQSMRWPQASTLRESTTLAVPLAGVAAGAGTVAALVAMMTLLAMF